MKSFPFRNPALAALTAAFLVATAPVAMSQEKLKVLLVDGQNNHAWAETTPVMVGILEKSGRFEVTVSTSPPGAPRGPRPPQDKSDEAKAKFAAEMKAAFRKVDAAAGKRTPAPAATKRPAPSGPQGAEPPPLSDADIPF